MKNNIESKTMPSKRKIERKEYNLQKQNKKL